MRVRILGPFHLEDGGRRITIGGVRQRAVLADLLLHANEVVASEPRMPAVFKNRRLRLAVKLLYPPGQPRFFQAGLGCT
jgi:hypothetical protein